MRATRSLKALFLCLTVVSTASAAPEQEAPSGTTKAAELSLEVETTDSQEAAPSDEQDTPITESSPAAEVGQSGFAYGLRAGASLPYGSADGGTSYAAGELRSGSMSGLAAIALPVWLDLGYQLNPQWWIGLGAQLTIGSPGEDCPDNSDCSWTSLRLGAQTIYTFTPEQSMRPWLAASLGWESLEARVTAPFTLPSEGGEDADQIAVSAKETLSGPELILQGGLAFDVGEGLTVGPYLSASGGMYLKDTYDCPSALLGCPGDDAVEDHKLHGWLSLGVRGTHGP